MIRYRLTERQICDSKGDGRTSWGVALVVDGVCIRKAEDLSPDREAVRALVKLFNDEELDPVHFDQAIEDFLYDFTI